MRAYTIVVEHIISLLKSYVLSVSRANKALDKFKISRVTAKPSIYVNIHSQVTRTDGSKEEVNQYGFAWTVYIVWKDLDDTISSYMMYSERSPLKLL